MPEKRHRRRMLLHFSIRHSETTGSILEVWRKTLESDHALKAGGIAARKVNMTRTKSSLSPISKQTGSSPMSRPLIIGSLLFLNGLAWLAGSSVGAAGIGVGVPYGTTFDFELLTSEHASGKSQMHSISGPGSFTLHFDGTPQNLPSYCCGLDTTPMVTEFTINGDGTSTVQIVATSPNGSDLYPSGLLGNGNVPQTDAALRIGYFSGSIPLAWNPPHTVLSATVDMQRSDGTSIFGDPISLDPATFFGAPGPWDGNLAVVFPNQVGKGVSRVDLRIVVASSNDGGACVADATTLCLSSGRFKVQVAWQALHLGTSGTGQAVPLTSDTGYFWFFGSSNVELIIKVLDGTPVNGDFWVFYGALSNVQYTITVTDTKTGRSKVYFNPQDTLASVADTSAFGPFPTKANAAPNQTALNPQMVASQARPSGCTPTSTTLCLNEGRFEVTAVWRDFQGNIGAGTAVPLTTDTGYFWFFAPTNIEVVVKALDGRGLNNHFWIYYGALSTVDYAITVRDTQTGATRAYRNKSGDLASIADTNAFTGLEAPAQSSSALHDALLPYTDYFGQDLASVSPSVNQVAMALNSAIDSIQHCLEESLAGSAICPGIDFNTGTLIHTQVTAESAQFLSALLSPNSGVSNTSSKHLATALATPAQCLFA
ncbi:MAG TPA: hypothetical protein VGQ28_09200, partial [Thermoanaerobaculia bacterium]|nr:hypothetical protein [Thermoanaerobaculia bacterium]